MTAGKPPDPSLSRGCFLWNGTSEEKQLPVPALFREAVAKEATPSKQPSSPFPSGRGAGGVGSSAITTPTRAMMHNTETPPAIPAPSANGHAHAAPPPDGAAAVMMRFQEVMARFLDTQKSVMLRLPQAASNGTSGAALPAPSTNGHAASTQSRRTRMGTATRAPTATVMLHRTWQRRCLFRCRQPTASRPNRLFRGRLSRRRLPRTGSTKPTASTKHPRSRS